MVKIMLNQQEFHYFNTLQSKIKSKIGVDINIIPLNHSLFLKDGDEIQGSCHRFLDDNGKVVKQIITIDENYIKACFYGRQTRYSKYSDFMLIETICHELAHLFIWEHSPEHDDLTMYFTRLIK